jgi:hypothetical protein
MPKPPVLKPREVCRIPQIPSIFFSASRRRRVDVLQAGFLAVSDKENER